VASAHISDEHSDITDHCYYWTRDTHAIAASAHYSDGHSDIIGPLLLLDTWHTHGCCLCHNNDGLFDISETVATVGYVAHARLLLAPIAAMAV
jgi:hypothetical protein